jgi:hypothetical protein
MTSDPESTHRLRKLTDELDRYIDDSVGNAEWRHEMVRQLLVELHSEVHRLQRGAWRNIIGDGHRWGGMTGPWTATFADGPLAECGYDHHFIVGPVLRELVFIPADRLTRDPWWTLVGWDDCAPDPAWSDQVAYRLAGEMAGADGEPIGLYELAR